MKPGKEVTYTHRGKTTDAAVHAVSGTGPSGYKVLDLLVDRKVVTGVKHRTDDASTFWMLPGESSPVVPDSGASPAVRSGRDTAGEAI